MANIIIRRCHLYLTVTEPWAFERPELEQLARELAVSAVSRLAAGLGEVDGASATIPRLTLEVQLPPITLATVSAGSRWTDAEPGRLDALPILGSRRLDAAIEIAVARMLATSDAPNPVDGDGDETVETVLRSAWPPLWVRWRRTMHLPAPGPRPAEPGRRARRGEQAASTSRTPVHPVGDVVSLLPDARGEVDTETTMPVRLGQASLEGGALPPVERRDATDHATDWRDQLHPATTRVGQTVAAASVPGSGERDVPELAPSGLEQDGGSRPEHDRTSTDPDDALAVPTRAIRSRRVYLPTVLPFLLVPPMEQLGLLDTLAEVFPEDDGAAATFAWLLAQKVLPVRELGWHREPEFDLVALVFAGLDDAPTADAIDALAGDVGRWAPPIAQVVRDVVAAGFTDGGGIVASSNRHGGLVVAEAETVIPLCWNASIADLGGIRAELRDPPLSATATVGEALGTVKDAGALAELDRAVDLLADRPAAQDPHPDLEDALDLVTAAALGTLSWIVSAPGERCGPAAAYDEFHDLDAHATVDNGEVEIEWGSGGRYSRLRAGLQNLLTTPTAVGTAARPSLFSDGL